MKSFRAWMLLLAASLLAGCAFGEGGVVLAPVGPPPLKPEVPSSAGSLKVYTALDPGAHFNSLPYHVFHGDYKILSEEGKFLKTVHNDSGTALEGPVRVYLPAGSYRVVAPANGYGTVTVSVLIEADRTTIVHLDGGGSWPNRAAMLQFDPIRLPDGRIVGWRAKTPEISRSAPESSHPLPHDQR